MISRWAWAFPAMMTMAVLFGQSLQAAGHNKESAAIREHSISISELRQGIRAHLDKILATSQEESSLLDQLADIDGRLTAQRGKLDTLNERLAAQEKLLASKTKDLERAEQARETVRQHLKKRLRAFYLMGRAGVLNVSFSGKTLPELMLINDSFRQLLNYDQQLMAGYRETIANQQRARDAQVLEKSMLQDVIHQQELETEALAALQEEKSNLLHRVKTQKGLYEQALREMEQAERDLSATISRLKSRASNLLNGFEKKKGKLPPPVKGWIRSRFGQAKESDAIPATSTGITIETAQGEAVVAVSGGRVVYAGYERGYGNMVIIDHGQRYYTITSRIENLLVTKDEQVASGGLLGTTGDLATLFDEGLYFEIRHGDQPLNPELWLRPDSLPFMDDQVEAPQSPQPEPAEAQTAPAQGIEP